MVQCWGKSNAATSKKLPATASQVPIQILSLNESQQIGVELIFVCFCKSVWTASIDF